MPEQLKPRHYVYTLAYPESMGSKVFYVGKGVGVRIDAHERETRRGAKSHKCSVIRKIWASGGEVVKTKLAYFETHKEACMYEIALIFFMDGLTNRTYGGDGSMGVVISEETRRNLSKANWVKGRTLSEEHKRKISESKKGKTTLSEESRRRMSESKKADPSVLERLREMRKIQKEKGLSEERKRQIGEVSKRPANIEHLRRLNEARRGKPGHPQSAETRRKLSEIRKGTRQA